MIDVYFTCVCGIHPMIEKEKLKYFVNTCLYQFENKSAGEELILEDNIWIKSIGEMKCLYALYLALMSVSSQIVADLETVDKYLKKAEIEIATISVEHSTEFYWAVACHYLFIGFVGEGDQYKLGYYLAKVNYFIESQSETCTNPFLKILCANSNLISSRYKTEIFTLQTLLEGTRNMFHFFTNRKVEDVLLPGTWDYMMNTKLSQQNYLLFKQVLDFIFKVFNHCKHDITKSVKDCHGEDFFKIQRLFACLLSEGFAFMFMKQIPEISFNVMEEIALKITLMTEHELFPVLFLATVGFAIEAGEFHLQICKEIEMGLKPRTGAVKGVSGRLITFDYFSILEKDLRALNLLAARYRRITKFYSKLMTEMSQIIERNKTIDMLVHTISYSEIQTTSSQPPQQDEILRKQLEQADFESFLTDYPLGDEL
ncbi:predicted protein [Naegleria gruberi]|uniref:Predicted protein n=1 Tax=Naegleria gruberi TaxID=5762 RepID=D2VYX1_NAEGR|nr:uncharacterized protein NAEGRDRAFT_74274 [Naegleria gruberi]EFC37988.1 predicted protein [Naegleria gruberi]|eukprot:XP_002670732.1 predicted protein [Naegleria gruberi strain NEG-M]